jgi:hypothetical protein
MNGVDIISTAGQDVLQRKVVEKGYCGIDVR